ncbi:MAG: glycine cleavage system protein GcvH [Sphingobacteriales bacterium]|nr:MAG: glycine cleavage system protein GcvH [Sphingobacteriales bacterium]
MEFPEELYYTADHEWINLEGDTAVVGITAFAAGELGDIVFIDIPKVGEKIEAGEIFGTVEAVKTVSDLILPVGGSILEVNPKVIAWPALVNNDPYGDGWLVKISMDGPAKPGTLLNDEQYRELLG